MSAHFRGSALPITRADSSPRQAISRVSHRAPRTTTTAGSCSCSCWSWAEAGACWQMAGLCRIDPVGRQPQCPAWVGAGEGAVLGESLPADEPGVAPASVVVSLKQSPFVSVTCPCHEEKVSNSRKNMLTPEYRLAARYLVNFLLLLFTFPCLSAPITTIKSPMSSSSRKRKKVVS